MDFIKRRNWDIPLKYPAEPKQSSFKPLSGVPKVYIISGIPKEGNSSMLKTYKAIDDTRLYAIGIIGGVGASFNRYTLDIRYEQNNGISNMPTVKSSVRAFYFLVGYRF